MIPIMGLCQYPTVNLGGYYSNRLGMSSYLDIGAGYLLIVETPKKYLNVYPEISVNILLNKNKWSQEGRIGVGIPLGNGELVPFLGLTNTFDTSMGKYQLEEIRVWKPKYSIKYFWFHTHPSLFITASYTNRDYYIGVGMTKNFSR